ncbi:MAG: hypothetical protein DRH51_06170, partial [Candidatus Coatesbacteria bacterium]
MSILGRLKNKLSELFLDRNNSRRVVISRRKHMFAYKDDVPLDAFKRMRDDPQVSAGLSVIKLPILAQKFSVEGSPEVADTIVKAISGSYTKIV